MNTISIEAAVERTGSFPVRVGWIERDGRISTWLRHFVSSEMAEGVAWKLCTVRLFPNQYDLSLDNDLICGLFQPP